MKKKKSLIFGVSITVILILGIIITYRNFFIPNGISIDKNKYPITGIDISAHTGKVDFDKILTQKVDFIYLKATEGGNFIDPKFNENYSDVSTKKIPVGFYHFFRFDKEGEIQANNFLKNIKDKKTSLPLVIDVEEWGNVSSKSTEEIVSEISTFIKIVENKTESKLMFYSNESSYNKYIKGIFDKNEIWICSFSKNRISKKNGLSGNIHTRGN